MVDNEVLAGTLASLLASLGTSLGALGIFFVKKMSKKTSDLLLSGAAGLMISAAFTSLLSPAIGYAAKILTPKFFAVPVVAAGLLAGAWVMHTIHNYTPHEHFVTGRKGPASRTVKRIWLFIIAIVLHNVPEGMAAGVGFAGGDTGHGSALALGIGIQNIPEGLAVAVSLMAIDYPRRTAFMVASLTGFAEPLGGLVGSFAAWYIKPLVPSIMGFAAGAMIFIIINEIIPETHQEGNGNYNSFSFLAGIIIMFLLDTVI